MAGTAFSTVIDTFMTKVDDYRLIALYQSSVPDFETYVSAWLISAIVKFKNCNQSLAYSSSTNTFTETLTDENIEILALLMKEKWLEKEISDITQMNLRITDKDFKSYSEAQNLKEKRDLLSQLKEEVSQVLVSYGYSDSSLWSDWLSGTFYSV